MISTTLIFVSLIINLRFTPGVVELEEAAHPRECEVVGQLGGDPVDPEEAGRHAAGVCEQLVVGGHDVRVIVPAADGRVGPHGYSGLNPKSLCVRNISMFGTSR